MSTDCTLEQVELQGFPKGRRLVAKLDGGTVSSDGGAVLLQQADESLGLLERFAECFTDHRDAERCEHTVEELLRQRIFALGLGYEDLNDHDELRLDPLLAWLVGKADPTGADRRLERDRGKPLAGKSTLNRLEWGLAGEAAEVAEALEREKRRKAASLDQTVIDLLTQALGVATPRSNGLGRLAGDWSEEDFPEFERAVASFDAIDD